ncbi:TlpA family protein disulfide reductase [Novosphingobium aerophilum]|uniref:TlpA family protein disulfide reductase n=1 Tax=Novosphingobium aerophilum TaxID=2839843 RepID=UPI001F346B93|nr:TlpA disulfide reductase family protein [Novosphingobium aerophilum]
MLISRSLTSLVLGCSLPFGVLALGGCDRQADPSAQGATTAATAPATAAAQPGKGPDHTNAGTPLPNLSFTDPTGRELALESLAGRPVLINLWATWCAPCVKELPTLEALAGSGAVRVVTVSQDSGDPAKVAAFLKDKGLKRLQPWLDPNNDLAFHYNGGTLPMTVLYDSEGKEVWRFTGENDWSSPETRALLAEAG